jgi:hypothetical protein
MMARFLQLLSEATAAIPAHYFQLPVADREDPIYRERVYCYELYHQLRMLLEADPLFRSYALSGEVDKSGHPIIRLCVPDFVLHAPGNMRSNLVVMEVKSINARRAGIEEDITKLSYFTSDEVGYECGIELVYGDDEAELEKFRSEFPRDNPRLHLLWHQGPGTEAVAALALDE